MGALALAGLAFRDFPPGIGPIRARRPALSLGRTVYSMRYYQHPSTNSDELGYYISDTVIEILQQASGDPGTTNNRRWLKTEDGWLNSAYVQPVKNDLNQPVLDIPTQGMLVEVTVPYTQSYRVQDNTWKRGYRYYYKSTHWVYSAFTTDNDVVWYQVLDDLNGGYSIVEAAHMRPVNPEELAPISPGVPDKLVTVDLEKQLVTAYEGDRPVYATRTSTGYFEGTTPKGEFRVERKRPSRHMTPFDGNGLDLPGVPWVCFISWTGVALHGTYWHNNYGTPESRGCINLTPEASLWFYRWTDPIVPPGEDFIESDDGTRVEVI
jgi:lipoprotein-anchoring transpeptidase ErfK/SrfK